MKNLRMITRTLLTASLLVTGFSYAMETVPADWYRLPEDGGVRNLHAGDRQPRLFVETLRQLLSADAEVMEGLEDKVGGGWLGSNPPPNAVDWRLYSLLTELGISAKGVIAPISLKGTATVGVFWRKKPPADEAWLDPHADGSDSPVGLLLTPASTREEIRRQLEPMIQLALSTKKVKDEAELRKNLNESADLFWRLSEVLSSENRPWWVSRFRLDLWIDIAGTVHPGVAVGGEFKLRFEWHRLMKENLPVTHPVMHIDDELQKEFRKFIEDLSSDVEDVSYDGLRDTGFFPNTIRFGLGISVKGTFGVVKLGGGIVGMLFFSTPPPTREAIYHPARVRQNDSLPFIVYEPSERHVTYAKQHHIPFEITKQDRGIIQEIIYKIDHAAFRRGLTKAVGISSRFAEGAAKSSVGKWKIHEIRPSFELSIGGDLGLASITGSASVEMSFLNGKF